MANNSHDVYAIIRIENDNESDTEAVEIIGEMMSHLDASYSFSSQIVKKCYCDNGIFYFTKDNLLKDSQICGNCKGLGYVGFDYDSKTGKFTPKNTHERQMERTD